MESRIQNLMTSLKISREEAIQVIADDDAIDRGEKLFELDAELQEGAKKARRGERKQTTTTKREHKPNDEKRFLIDTLVWALTTDIDHAGDNVNATDINVINGEREFTFTYNETKYKVVLSCPRT